MLSPVKQRAVAPDVIRCFALFTVVGVHFFLHNGFYQEIIHGPVMYLSTVLASFFRICVPLFLLLSGYLLRTRPLTWCHFPKLGKTLALYLLASLVCMVYTILFHFKDTTVFLEIYGIFSYTTAPYAWYIELYIGLFLLIPFLNILYNNLQNQRQEQMLILVMLVLTALPGVVNIYRLLDLPWWKNPASSSAYYMIFPDWWTGIYPLTYYFIGCYLSKHPPKIKPVVNLLLVVIAAMAFGSFNYYRSHNTQFVAGAWQDYSSFMVVVLSVLVFNFFLVLDYSKLSDRTKYWLSRMSDWSLGAYLLSWIFDTAVYILLSRRVSTMPEKLPFFLLTVPVIYCCSLAASAGLNWVQKQLGKCLAALLHHFVRTK